MSAGSNASYVEDQRRIAKMDCTQQPLSEEDVTMSSTMIVNTEWPGFSPNAYRLLGVDRELDAASYRPGDQPFEKLTGHLYLGEITRRILLRSDCSQIQAHQLYWLNALFLGLIISAVQMGQCIACGL